MKQNRKNREGKLQYFLEAGSLILALAFPVSFFGGLSVTIPLAETRILDVLIANPQRYLDYVRDAFLSMILLPALGLVLSIIGFVGEIKHPTEILDKWWLLLTVFGGFFFFWGAYMLSWTYTNYSYITRLATSSVDIMKPLQAVYAAVSVGDVLWIFAGILFMLSPIFKLILTKKSATTAK
jgi:hypothetical protein